MKGTGETEKVAGVRAGPAEKGQAVAMVAGVRAGPAEKGQAVAMMAEVMVG